jgi:hypothetical protein
MNTPYPSTAYLQGYLKQMGAPCAQADLGIELLLKIFNRAGLEKIYAELPKQSASDSVVFFKEAFADYANTIEPVIRFLQGKDPSLALRISQRQILPEGPRFVPLAEHPEVLDSFGTLGVQDLAKYIASLYIDDLADVVREGIDGGFGLSRYQESLASSQASFSPLYERLQKSSLIDNWIEELTKEYLEREQPEVLGLSCPFPGNLYSALRIAQYAKKIQPKLVTILGGGFVNTELRSIEDTRAFSNIDFLIYDDGEAPLMQIVKGEAPKSAAYIKNGKVVHSEQGKAVAFKSLNGPDYSGLPLEKYFSMLEMPNAMHRLWSDFKWNKLMLAHGCYWKKCTFCDVSLDYIQRFEPQKAAHLVDQMEAVIAQTGVTGFHFVDEAAPPALLIQLSDEILKRKLQVTWWGNIRFDSQFTPEVCQKMADAGCVAVTGGIEVASPRLLELINKGVTLEQVTTVTRGFSKAGILVHAYLMYGYPSQTAQETIDSLEVVRQLFANGCLRSAHWHRFVATVHSPVGRDPKKYGIELHRPASPQEGLFAENSLPFTDSVKTDHTMLGEGLRRALYNYMHGIGFDTPVNDWFAKKVPPTKVKKTFVRKLLFKN